MNVILAQGFIGMHLFYSSRSRAVEFMKVSQKRLRDSLVPTF